MRTTVRQTQDIGDAVKGSGKKDPDLGGWICRHSRCCAIVTTLLVLSTTVRSGQVAAAQTESWSERREGLDTRLAMAIDEFRSAVPKKMKEGKIRGAAIALLDGQGVVWSEGFGYADLKERIRVTPRTPFLVGGISTMITATAVMKAVQDGVVELDEPIRTYVPRFNVRSRYEEDPESRITLRHLLGHTSGLPGAAPLGNFFEPSPLIPFDGHVESLFGSWLVCPVGTGLDYGRPNYDLAAYVLQTVSKTPIDRYFKERLFTPLGMTNTTVNRKEILQRRDRAEGHQFAAAELPAVNPFLGSGGAYSTAKDIARLVQLHLNGGEVHGNRFLEESTVALMHSPVASMASSPDHYKFYGTYPLRFSSYKLRWWAELAVLILGKDEWTPRIKVHEKDGFLCVTESTFFSKLGDLWPRHVDEGLEEMQPGLFITAKGWVLDFREEAARWGNYRLEK